ncbi:hypothetical protein KC19_8G090500 [Ceratodon purpureus]|uniref:GDSL esterase/lipase n=1 Tax=Ceratodon purpureus TaxID=3225 RepID=A0A8T0H265_CERPU|nr:hypothetical protein KC19_8G090500 [Ceratodon purpureus]
MGKCGVFGARVLCWGALMLCVLQVASAALPNCSYPGVFAFGDSLSDTGNSIAAFPEKFANAELDPNGILFPTHAADRYTDGKLLLDFLAFGVRRRPIYPVLRGTGGDFTFGTNFAAYGAPARTVKVWYKDDGFNVPFSLDVQHQWSERYKIRVWFYESPIFNPPGRLVQSLPKLATWNESLFVVWSGYQDYFFSLYDKKLTVSQTKKIVGDVVAAIEEHIVKLLTPVVYIPPATPSMIMPIAQTIMVVNLPPLGCIPAMLTLYGGPKAKYDQYGCLSELNKITSAHNKLLTEKIIALRAKYPAALILDADAHGVYTDILKNPKSYNVTAPLSACCGVGGSYNFNTGVTCGHAGLVDGKFVNLTTSLPATPCANPRAHLSWDGIHTSNTFNKAAATDFLTGKHITPAGGLGCSPDFFFFDSST